MGGQAAQSLQPLLPAGPSFLCPPRHGPAPEDQQTPEGVDTGCSLPVSLPPGEGNLTSSCRAQPGGQRTPLGACSGPGPPHLAPQGVRRGLPSRGRQPWSFDTGPREAWELTSEVRVGEGRVGEEQSGHFRQRYQVQRQEGGRDGGLPGTTEESSQVSESFYIIRGTWKVALRSFCTRGTLGRPRGYVTQEPMLPRLTGDPWPSPDCGFVPGQPGGGPWLC